jgi:hypothetical protein
MILKVIYTYREAFSVNIIITHFPSLEFKFQAWEDRQVK